MDQSHKCHCRNSSALIAIKYFNTSKESNQPSVGPSLHYVLMCKTLTLVIHLTCFYAENSMTNTSKYMSWNSLLACFPPKINTIVSSHGDMREKVSGASHLSDTVVSLFLLDAHSQNFPHVNKWVPGQAGKITCAQVRLDLQQILSHPQGRFTSCDQWRGVRDSHLSSRKGKKCQMKNKLNGSLYIVICTIRLFSI